MRNAKGMTLVEIMIVLAIVGFLAVAIGGQVNTQMKKARVNETRIVMGELGKALDLYYQDCGQYPQDLGALLSEDPNCKNWGPEPYVKNEKKFNDGWSRRINYDLSGSTYTLVSLGADGKEGGSGYDKDISSADF